MDAATTERFVTRFLEGMEYEAGRTGPPEGFPKFPSIPGGRYTDPAFLEAERQALWKRTWLYACHVDELPDAGSFMLWTRTGSPILIVRGKDLKIRAFYNTCRHRGAPLVKTETGRCDGLVCSYHGWTYALDGQLINLRDKRDFVDLQTGEHSLVAVRCEQFANWVFINEDPDAQPLLENIAPFPAHFEQFQPENLRFVHKKGYDLKCNVKVLLDAFLEVYHLKSIHTSTVDRFLDHRGMTTALYRNGHSLMVTPNRRPDWVDPGTKGMKRVETATVISAKNNPSWNFYPNLVVPIDPSGCPFLIFWPTGNDTMRIECHWFAPDWGGGELHPLWPTRIENFERILYEDLQFAEQIQKSVESPGFRGMTLNYQERRIYNWHEELDRRIDRAGIAIPDALRVAPLLEPYLEN
ncbi:MAG TPA: aromatic ring-hydroxylating dioxygenase subunit alpha [Steroidobacteraceae bacterium]